MKMVKTAIVWLAIAAVAFGTRSQTSEQPEGEESSRTPAVLPAGTWYEYAYLERWESFFGERLSGAVGIRVRIEASDAEAESAQHIYRIRFTDAVVVDDSPASAMVLTKLAPLGLARTISHDVFGKDEMLGYPELSSTFELDPAWIEELRQSFESSETEGSSPLFGSVEEALPPFAMDRVILFDPDRMVPIRVTERSRKADVLGQTVTRVRALVRVDWGELP